MGLAIIIFTVIVRLLILPITNQTIKDQAKMAVIQPKIKEIQNKFKDQKEEQTRRVMELYKEHKTGPFSGCLLMLFQVFVFITLFRLFRSPLSSSFHLLYSFVSSPSAIEPYFLGLVDLSKGNILFSVLVGVSQWLQTRLMPQSMPSQGSGGGFASDFSKAMQFQMKYFLPVFIGFISYSLPSALALHWTISNFFAIVQQSVFKKKSVK